MHEQAYSKGKVNTVLVLRDVLSEAGFWKQTRAIPEENIIGDSAVLPSNHFGGRVWQGIRVCIGREAFWSIPLGELGTGGVYLSVHLSVFASALGQEGHDLGAGAAAPVAESMPSTHWAS